MIAERPINEMADAMAARLKAGINEAFQRTEVSGFAYGIASMVNFIFGVDPKGDQYFEAPPLTYEDGELIYQTGKGFKKIDYNDRV